MNTSSNNGWADPLDNEQTIVMYVMSGLATALLFSMLGLSGYVFYSFYSKVFSAGVMPLRVLRFLGTTRTKVLI